MRVNDEERVGCPYCGESIELAVEAADGRQHYIEDCPVCCRPMDVLVEIGEDGVPIVQVESENDAGARFGA